MIGRYWQSDTISEWCALVSLASRILQVSSQLPLSEAAAMPNGVAFAFASGLAVKGNTVLVTYGAGDREARALVMTMEKLDVTWQDGRGKSPRLN